MHPVSPLISFVLRQLVNQAVDFLQQRLIDPSQKLPKTLTKANDRAWQALAVALAGDSLVDKVKNWFKATADERAFAEQVRLFLAGVSSNLRHAPEDFRQRCLADLNRARQAGSLSAANAPPKELVQQTARFQRFADPTGMVKGAEQVMAEVADAIAYQFPQLAILLRQPTPGGPPLLVAAFAYFLRREIETDAELAHGLFFDGLKQLSASQEQAFSEVSNVLATLGQNFDRVFEQLGRIEAVVVETHDRVLDLQIELQRIGSLQLTNAAEVRQIMEDVLGRVFHLGMQKGEIKPQHSFSIHNEEERRAIKELLARFRQMPASQQQQVPALLNNLGKLQMGSGDFQGAGQSFLAVAQCTRVAAAKAVAHYNAYRAALEEKKWAEALTAIHQASLLDGQRFAPFPIQRYQPKRILGAGGFGTAFLCHDANFAEEVVVKTLHAADMQRSMTDVFREARLLRKLNHPAIIGVHECEFADPLHQARPYLVMDYFAGGSLQSFIEDRGTLSPDDVVAVARQVAEGLLAAHKQDILHRDIKPDNVLVRKQGATWSVKIIDFGLALRKQTIETSVAVRSEGSTVLGDSVAGTIKYAPPEQMGQIKGVKPGPYSDVYAFGKMCCFALFKTTEPKDRHWKSVPEEVRTPLKEMLDQCREEELEHRLPDFSSVLQVLMRLAPANRGQQSRPSPTINPTVPATPKPQQATPVVLPVAPKPIQAAPVAVLPILSSDAQQFSEPFIDVLLEMSSTCCINTSDGGRTR